MTAETARTYIPITGNKRKKALAYLTNSPYSSHLIFSSLQGNIGYAFFACLKNPVFVFA